MTSNRYVLYLISIEADKPHNASFAFVGNEIGKLIEFLNHIQAMPLKGNGPMKITDEDLRRVVLSNVQARSLFQDNEELFAEIIHSSITKEVNRRGF